MFGFDEQVKCGEVFVNCVVGKDDGFGGVSWKVCVDDVCKVVFGSNNLGIVWFDDFQCWFDCLCIIGDSGDCLCIIDFVDGFYVSQMSGDQCCCVYLIIWCWWCDDCEIGDFCYYGRY